MADIDRSKAVRLHITQDSSGHWMESFEMPDGKLYLTKFGIWDPTHDIEEAQNHVLLEANGYSPDIEVWVSETEMKRGDPVSKPRAARARKPYRVVKPG